MRFFTEAKLGPKQSLTPEGFLVCHDVPIARTGTLTYGGAEVPIEPGRDGIVIIERQPGEVFRSETLASFEGKPITLDHPSEFVGPGNWAALAKGVTQNVRQGSGLEQDFILADLLITDEAAIADVREGLREVSCGYEADYEQTEPGRGVQRNIIGNHVALVERGRCGPRCAIGDAEKEIDMSKKRTWKDRIREAFKAKDADEMEKALTEAEAKDADGDEDEDDKREKTGDRDALAAIVRDTIAPLGERLSALESRLTKDADGDDDEDDKQTEDEDEDEDEDKREKTGDGADLIARFQDSVSRAEILAPGLRFSTVDAKADRAKVADAICGCQRKALEAAYSTDAGKAVIAPLLRGTAPAFDKMACATLDMIFVAASEMVKSRNNASSVRASVTTQDFGRSLGVSDINSQNRKFWDRSQTK